MNKLNLNGSISQLNFSSKYEAERVCQILANAGVKTLGHLCMLTKKQLFSVDQIGKVTIHVIDRELKDAGLRLGMTSKELEAYMSYEPKGMPPMEGLEEALDHFIKILTGHKSEDGKPEKTGEPFEMPVMMVFRLM